MSALSELIEALRTVEHHLDRACRQTANARGLLGEAGEILIRADPNHPEMVVPPELGNADGQIERTQGQLDHATELLREFVARL